METRRELLESCTQLTLVDRMETYGDPVVNYEFLGQLRRLYESQAQGKYSRAHDEAMGMVMLKLMRIACGQFHEDNYLDAINYLAIAFECEQCAKTRLLAKLPVSTD